MITVIPPKPHLIIDFYGCDAERLNDLKRLKSCLYECARVLGATTIGDVFHQFSPYGVTGVLAIAESHLSVHTWVEAGYAAVDLFMCNSNLNAAKVERAVALIAAELGAESQVVNAIQRGAALCTPQSSSSTAKTELSFASEVSSRA